MVGPYGAKNAIRPGEMASQKIIFLSRKTVAALLKVTFILCQKVSLKMTTDRTFW